MFNVSVQDHMMVAHSLPDPFFGPAQNLHGATYVVRVCLRAVELDTHGVVLDIGAAATYLAAIMADLSYRNLDDHPAFEGVVTTTEVLARHIARRMADAIDSGSDNDERRVGQRLCSIDVTLHEHPGASAGYHLALPQGHADEQPRQDD